MKFPVVFLEGKHFRPWIIIRATKRGIRNTERDVLLEFRKDYSIRLPFLVGESQISLIAFPIKLKLT